MASTVDAEGTTESKQRLTGDKFIRPHLRKLSPYQPILPFEVSETVLVDLSVHLFPDFPTAAYTVPMIEFLWV